MSSCEHRRAKLEEQRRRILKWLEASFQPGSTEFLRKCDRFHEIERELSELDDEEQ